MTEMSAAKMTNSVSWPAPGVVDLRLNAPVSVEPKSLRGPAVAHHAR